MDLYILLLLNGVFCNICRDRPNIMKPYIYDCKKYIQCYNGVELIRDCSPFYFEPNLMTCVLDEPSTCNFDETTFTTTTNVTNTMYPITTTTHSTSISSESPHSTHIYGNIGSENIIADETKSSTTDSFVTTITETAKHTTDETDMVLTFITQRTTTPDSITTIFPQSTTPQQKKDTVLHNVWPIDTISQSDVQTLRVNETPITSADPATVVHTTLQTVKQISDGKPSTTIANSTIAPVATMPRYDLPMQYTSPFNTRDAKQNLTTSKITTNSDSTVNTTPVTTSIELKTNRFTPNVPNIVTIISPTSEIEPDIELTTTTIKKQNKKQSKKPMKINKSTNTSTSNVIDQTTSTETTKPCQPKCRNKDTFLLFDNASEDLIYYCNLGKLIHYECLSEECTSNNSTCKFRKMQIKTKTKVKC